MFIGHYALGLASKKIDQTPSLAVMFVAVQFLDLLWPIFVLLGIEKFQIEVGNTTVTPLNFTFYPYSHSLLTSLVWGILFGMVYYLITKNGKGSFLLSGLVFSHWILDFLTHRPDLPLSPLSEYKVGLGLWNYPVIESVVEVGLFVVGVVIYHHTVKPKRRVAFWSLIITLFTIHIMNILGPPPPGVMAVAWSANLMWLFVLWAWWIEKKSGHKG
jgi:membrane-bound metal-dependent hydrolase YbcI (DUF457 family)